MTSARAEVLLARNLGAAAAVGGFFLLGSLVGYDPVIGGVVVAALIYCLVQFFHPAWFTYLYVAAVAFSAMLLLPVTTDGFALATAVALSSFAFCTLRALATKDDALMDSWFGRWDHMLPALFVLIMIVSMKNSTKISTSAKQVQQFIYVVATYLFLQLTVRSEKVLRNVMAVFVTSGVLVGVLGIVEAVIEVPVYSLLDNNSLFGQPLSVVFLNAKRGRINGLIGDAPFHGVYMSMVALASAYYVFGSRARWARLLGGISLLVAAFNIMGTGSRGAAVAFVVGLAVFWRFVEVRRKKVILGAVAGTLGLLAMVMLLALPGIDVKRVFTQETGSEETAELRWQNIPVAMKMFGKHPIIGNGPDSFVIDFHRYGREFSRYAARTKVLRVHNTPLQILAEYGLVGVAVFGMAIWMALRRLRSAARAGAREDDRLLAGTLMGVIVAYCFFMCTSNSMLDSSFWLAIALGQAHYTISLRGQGSTEWAVQMGGA